MRSNPEGMELPSRPTVPPQIELESHTKMVSFRGLPDHEDRGLQ